MITNFLYDKVKNHQGRLAAWGLKHIFRLHAWELGKGITERFNASTAMIERDWSAQCADMIDEMGLDAFTYNRHWVPLRLPEKLNQVEIGIFRQDLERVKNWYKTQLP